jgi:hypothetical protein
MIVKNRKSFAGNGDARVILIGNDTTAPFGVAIRNDLRNKNLVAEVAKYRDFRREEAFMIDYPQQSVGATWSQ